ncbi:MAG: cobalamin-dependent protein, partial [Chloroflexi bacterium]|nr:cobalamin-dependent protein [Chloroflexota bacterium]
MRILMIATNRHHRLMNRMDARPLPIGLAYVAGHLDPARHAIRVLDLMFAEDYLAEVESTIKDFKPDLVGISIRNLATGSYLDPQWALPSSKEVIQKVRATTKATIVCGGPAFSVLPKEVYAYVEPDLGIAGDAGETFAELAGLLDTGEPYHHLPGLVFRE